MDAEEIERPLCIGDIVTLRFQRGFFVASEGMLEFGLTVRERDHMVEDYLFEVHLPNQYSASIELDEFEASMEGELEELAKNREEGDEEAELAFLRSKEQMYKYLKALQRGKKNEESLNQSYMEQKRGSAIAYGESIQLRHLKSGKFLTVSSSEVADVERENMRVYLTEDGNSSSWIQLMPRFKIDRDGDPVLNEGEAYLRLAERPNEFLHASNSTLSGKTRSKEFNCSLEKTPWVLERYQTYLSRTSDDLQAGDLVVIHDPETKALLRTPQDRPSVLSHPEDDDNDSFIQNGSYTKDDMSESEEEDEEGDGEEKGGEDDEDGGEDIPPDQVLFDMTTSLATPDSNAIWVVEKVDGSGGILSWKKESFRLRHINTSKYLTLIPFVEEDGTTTFAFKLSSLQDEFQSDCHFKQLHSTVQSIQNSTPIQISFPDKQAGRRRRRAGRGRDGKEEEEGIFLFKKRG
jgi:hypothetical protein